MKLPASILAALLLTITLSASATAQTSASSTQPSASPVASEQLTELSNEQVKARLIADLKDLRTLHEATKTERDAALARLDSEQKVSASNERSYKIAESQIAALNRALEHQDRAIALYEKTIALVEKERDDAKKEAKRSRKVALISLGVTAAKVFGIF